MLSKDFFAHLLNVPTGWAIASVAWNDSEQQVEIRLEAVREAHFPCPQCGRPAPVCAYGDVASWRHLDVWAKRTYLYAALPVVNCPDHGRQTIVPFWSRAGASVTCELGQWCRELAKNHGGVRSAAAITGVPATEIRRMLRALQTETETDPRGHEAHLSQETGERAEGAGGRQLSLFAQSDMHLVNQGIQALKALQLEKAVQLFEKHRRLFPKGYKVTSKIAVAEFLLEGLRTAPPENPQRTAHLLDLWHAYEKCTELSGALQGQAAESIKQNFFAKLIEDNEHSGWMDVALINDKMPSGYLFLQAGKLDEAIQSLQASIAKTPENAAVYGYLGDAYWLRENYKTARQCYQEACLIDPHAIDWTHLQDQQLLELQEDLLLEYGFDEHLAKAWLPSHARISGLFERKVIRLHDGAREVVKRYSNLWKNLQKRHNPRQSAELFLLGVTLCENEETFKFVKEIDFIDVRKAMQQANPDLFEEFLENIISKRDRPAK